MRVFVCFIVYMFNMFVDVFYYLKSICYEISRYIFVVSRYIFVVKCATFYEVPRNQRCSGSDAQVVQQICSPSTIF